MRLSNTRPAIILLTVSAILLWALTACASSGGDDDNAVDMAATFDSSTPTEAVVSVLGEFDQRPTERADSATTGDVAWIEPIEAITLENVFQIALLGRLIPPTEGGTIFDYTFSADGTEMVVLNNRMILGYDLVSGRLRFNNTRQDAITVNFAPDKASVNTITSEGEGKIFDTSDGDTIYRFQAHPAFYSATTYAERGGWLAVGGMDGTVKVWDTFERESRVTIDAHTGRVLQLAFSSDEAHLASAGEDNRVVLWDWAEREIISEMEPADETTTGMVFSPDGAHLAVAGRERVTVWDVESGDLLHTLLVGAGGANDVLTYSPDGRFLVTGGQIPDMIVWDGQTGDLVGLLPDVGTNRVSANFSLDGGLLLTSVLDGPVSLWDMNQIDRANRTIVRADLPVESERIVNVAFTPDGYLMLLFDADGSVFVWGVPPAASEDGS